MWYEPVKHKMNFSAVRARDNRKIYDEYEKICVKSGLYSEDSKANYSLVRIDKNAQWCTEGGYAAFNISKLQGRNRPILSIPTGICSICHF